MHERHNSLHCVGRNNVIIACLVKPFSQSPANDEQDDRRTTNSCESYTSIRFGLPTKPGRVGSCITIFGACLAFTHVTAYTLAESP
jgi:hypothetical protein